MRRMRESQYGRSSCVEFDNVKPCMRLPLLVARCSTYISLAEIGLSRGGVPLPIRLLYDEYVTSDWTLRDLRAQPHWPGSSRGTSRLSCHLRTLIAIALTS